MKLSEIDIVQAYSKSSSSQEVKKFNGIAQQFLLIRKKNDVLKTAPKYS